MSVFVYAHSVYVDIDGTFNKAVPEDQLADFIPGSLRDGSSVAPIDMPQLITIHVVTGHGSRGDVAFALSSVSVYPGMAMNAPLANPDTLPDIDFTPSGTGSPAITKPIAKGGGAKWIDLPLYVRDYAASGTLKVTVPYGKTSFVVSVSLPVDRNGNRIADRGWRAETAWISDPGLAPGHDEDDSPVQLRALPDPADPGATGDNLTNFEEYRGFVLMGEHHRTNPFRKDLFVEAGDFGDDIQYAFPALPTATHRVSASEVGSGMGGIANLINPNALGLPGAGDPFPNGHQNQFVHRVQAIAGSGGGIYGGLTSCAPAYDS